MELSDNEILINRVSDLAKKNGHNVSKMEELCGFSPRSTINNWKKGSKPNIYAVAKIARFYGVSIDYLLGLENEKKPPADKQEAVAMAIAQELEHLTYDELAEILHHVMILKSQHDA